MYTKPVRLLKGYSGPTCTKTHFQSNVVSQIQMLTNINKASENVNYLLFICRELKDKMSQVWRNLTI